MSEKTRKNKSPFSLGVRKRTFPWLVPLASVRLTLVLLSLSMILIFVATLEQVRIGIRGAQAEYFESFFGVWHYPVEFWGGSILNFLPLPIPGGYLLGGLLIVNLIAAFVTRFQMTLKKNGDSNYPPRNHSPPYRSNGYASDSSRVQNANRQG